MRVAPSIVLIEEEQTKLEQVARARSLPARQVEKSPDRPAGCGGKAGSGNRRRA